MKKSLIPLAFAGLAVGCGGDVSTVPLDTGPAFQLVTNGPLPFPHARLPSLKEHTPL